MELAALFVYLRGRASERKIRLFACACLRRRPLIHYDRLREAVETGEDFADGLADTRELEEVADWARALWHQHVMRSGPSARLAKTDEAFYAQQVAGCLRYPANTLLWVAEADDLPLLHDVFGNPFRRVKGDPCWLAWNGRTCEKMARAIYEGRRFADLPLLADALEDAGCTDGALLGHCRQPGGHWRGCWALDLLLGRS
jgi:hypothetical protein